MSDFVKLEFILIHGRSAVVCDFFENPFFLQLEPVFVVGTCFFVVGTTDVFKSPFV